jgi:hypothetical protein
VSSAGARPESADAEAGGAELAQTESARAVVAAGSDARAVKMERIAALLAKQPQERHIFAMRWALRG